MRKLKQTTGVTFAVDAVTPATQRLPERRVHEVLSGFGGAVESCHDYHGTVVDKIYYHPLLAAVHTAFSDHRPLVLSPDAVWITIAQGVAQHMVIHGERLRSQFVSHPGKLDLVFECEGWVEGSPENPWAEAFESWTQQIRGHVGADTYDALVCDFSTSGPTERAASQVVMMDIFERYFHYEAYCICGIPAVTLEGTTDDWHRLTEKVIGLRKFDLDWWLPHLLQICEQFVRASRGDVDEKHWQGICKLRSAYGGNIINGWVAKLFPYIRSFIGGPCNRRNLIFETGEGFQSLFAPSGLSSVPFQWRDARTGREQPMEAIGGLVGVAQDSETLALSPKAGWAVRKAKPLDACLARLEKDHATFPGVKQPQTEEEGESSLGYALPPDLSEFYAYTNGAELFGGGDSARFRLVPRGQVLALDWGEKADALGRYGPENRIWHRIALLPDGSWLAINLGHGSPDPRPKQPGQWRCDPNFHAICHCSEATRNKPGLNPVVALSFTELLERLLDGGGKLYWLEPAFAGYGDAELYTRRD